MSFTISHKSHTFKKILEYCMKILINGINYIRSLYHLIHTFKQWSSILFHDFSVMGIRLSSIFWEFLYTRELNCQKYIGDFFPKIYKKIETDGAN